MTAAHENFFTFIFKKQYNLSYGAEIHSFSAEVPHWRKQDVDNVGDSLTILFFFTQQSKN